MNPRLILGPHRFENLATEQDAGPRLTRMLDQLTDAINIDRVVKVLPPPKNMRTVLSLGGAAMIAWDAVAPEFIDSLYAARIWRADPLVDPRTQFSENSSKRVIVDAILATAFLDVTPLPGTSLYWVQWIDRLNRVTDAAGGIEA